MIYYHARAHSRRGAWCPANARRCAAVCPGGSVAWQPAPFARPAHYHLAGRGTQQLGGASSGSACSRWLYPAAPGNRRFLRAAPSPRHQASRRRMRVPARHCAPRFPSIDGLETKIGRVHVSLPHLFPKGSFKNYVDRILPFFDPPAWTVFIPWLWTKTNIFDPLPSRLVHIVIEWPLMLPLPYGFKTNYGRTHKLLLYDGLLTNWGQ